MHTVSMLNERLQILVSSEQRRVLEDAARERGSSVASLVREAIDARFGGVSTDERIRAVESIAALSGRFLPLEELEDVIGEERLRASPTRR